MLFVLTENTSVSSPDYTGDFISFTGSIIGAIMTFLTVWWTIRYYRAKDKADTIEKEEKDRLSIAPYLYYKATMLEQYQNPNFRINFHSFKNGQMNVLKCLFIIKNVGLGTAIDIKFPKLYPFRENNMEDANIVLAAGELAVVELSADFNGIESTGNVIWLTCLYSDLLGNKYKQDVSIDIDLEKSYFRVNGAFKPELQLDSDDSLKE